MTAFALSLIESDDELGAGRRRKRATFPLVALFLCLLLGSTHPAFGQAAVKNPTQPILIYQALGHAGPVKALKFDKTTGRLLSGGLDKVVHVWDVNGDALKLVRTLRPPIWRGFNGSIYSLDLSSTPDASGESVLAIGGVGVQQSNGNITLMNYPGRANVDTGDVVGQLNGRVVPNDITQGHLGPVYTVKFHPNGKLLATGGDDGTIRLWDVATKRQLAFRETGAGRSIIALVFDPEGKSLWSGDTLGGIIHWNVTDPTNPLIMARGNPNFTNGRAVSAMTLLPGGEWLLAGLRNGAMYRLDAATLQTVNEAPGSATRGQILALASSPDGSAFAMSVATQPYNPAGNQSPPRTESVVEIRSVADGNVVAKVYEGKNRIQALAYNADGKLLAFAGDNAQSVFVHRVGTNTVLKAGGRGATVWDLGWSKDNKTLGLLRERDDDPAKPLVPGFNLTKREPELTPRADLSGARKTDGNWTIQAVDQRTLQVSGNNQAMTIQIPASALRWWEFSFIPDPDRPADLPPLVAVVCEAETRVYGPSAPDPNTGARVYLNTRWLNGHSGPVLAVAPTSDGKWLATGGDDQTARLWLTKNWGQYPTLGAKAIPQDGKMVIDSVEPFTFADAMGLKKGDVINQVVMIIDGVQQPVDMTEERWIECDGSPPRPMAFRFTRDGVAQEAFTTKRDSPVASLFVGDDLEWVLWTPESYYDTSVKGDAAYLGFHQNGVKAGLFEEDCSFSTIDKFEKELRKPQLFDRLIALADKPQAYATIQREDTTATVASKQTPVLKLGVPGFPQAPENAVLLVDSPELDVNVQVLTTGFDADVQGLKQIKVLVDSGETAVRNFNPPTNRIPPNTVQPYPFKVKLKPGLQTVSAIVSNAADVPQQVSMSLFFKPKAPPTPIRRPELVVVSAGTGEFAAEKVNPIAKVNEDLTDLSTHFSDKRNQRYQSVIPAGIVAGKKATQTELRGALDAVDKIHREKKLTHGDTVIVVMETHLVAIDEYQSHLLPFNVNDQDLPNSSIPTKEVTERLAKLAADGCHVLLVLDVNHANRLRPTPGLSASRGLKEWLRDLRKAKVMTCVAALGAPSSVDNQPNNLLARAILASADTKNWRRVAKPGEIMTLNDFKEVVENLVDRWSESKQVARFYEANIPLGIPFLTPPDGNLPVASADMK